MNKEILIVNDQEDTKILSEQMKRTNEDVLVVSKQKGHTEILSEQVMKEIKEHGIDIRSAEKKIMLPSVGEKFSIERNEYEVIYINIGRRRFPCQPLKGNEMPFLDKVFMSNGEEYVVTHVDLKKGRFTCEPYEGKNDDRTTEVQQQTE